MKQQEQQIHKCSKRQKRTARTAISCLLLLLLYGCADQERISPSMAILSEEADTVENDGLQTEDAVSRTDEEVLRTDADGNRGSLARETEKLAVFVCGAVRSPGV